MKKSSNRGFTLIELMIVVAIIGILAAIAIPNFIKFQARSKQAEAKTNLKAVFTGQKARYGERDRYSDLIGEIGYAPERGNRYAYELGTGAGAGAGACPAAQVEPRTLAAIPPAAYCGIDGDILRYGPAYGINTLRTNIAARGAIVFVPTTTGGTPAGELPGYDVALCPNCDFVARATGNVDNDNGSDEFYVSSQFMTMTAAGCAEATPAGLQEQPGSSLNSRNDVSCD